jgi:hypothetical protein
LSLSLNIKRTFLSFAQQYFRDVPTRYKWDPDPRLTKIFIGDKFSSKSATLEKYPSIILASNTKRWGRTSIDQRAKYPGLGVDNITKVRSDLVVGSITYQCLSSNPIEAELIADLLFENLVGYKDQFRSNDIHQLLDIQQGDSQQLRADTVGRLYAVPVTVYYAKQASITTAPVDYDLRVYTYTGNFSESSLQSIVGVEYLEALTYAVSGLEIVFNFPPASGLQLSARYVDAITLQEIDEVIGATDGVQVIYSLANIPYCLYANLNHINLVPGSDPTKTYIETNA